MEENKDKQKKDEPVQIVYEFKCASCGMSEEAQYKGTNPPFSRNIVLKYPSYIMKDPFSPPGKGEILVLGADCSVCEKPVCISKECSLFYCKPFCSDCVHKSLDAFPAQIKSKIAQLKKCSNVN